MPGFSAGFVRICGPADMGGRGDFLRSLESYAGLAEPQGEIVQIPGLPLMYDWESLPQDISAKAEVILAAEARISR